MGWRRIEGVPLSCPTSGAKLTRKGEGLAKQARTELEPLQLGINQTRHATTTGISADDDWVLGSRFGRRAARIAELFSFARRCAGGEELA